jgi:cyanuric acid amidohydrolase
MPIAKVHRISAASPDDVSGIESAIADGRIDPKGVIAVFGKTEGNGLVNDYARGYAALALNLMFQRHLSAAAAARICLVMSGGTEGGMSPHWTVFERSESQAGGGAALAIGRAHTDPLPAEELGRLAQIDMVAAAVGAAMRDSGIKRSADVHFVQVKCPLLTVRRVAEAKGRGVTVSTEDTLKSMGLSRAASALGVAVALGEVERMNLTEGQIGNDWGVWSGRASCSAGVELLGHEVVVLGMSPDWTGPLAVDHAVMADAIDIDPVRDALGRLGLAVSGQMPLEQRQRLRAVLSKAEASHDGRLREFRHTMLDDSDISSTRHARGFVCGVLAGLLGHAEIYVSGGAEHQGPDGGGPVALIVDRGGPGYGQSEGAIHSPGKS